MRFSWHGVRLRKYPLPCIRRKKKKQANQLVLACDVLSHSQRGVFTQFIIRPPKYAKLGHSQNLTSRSSQLLWNLDVIQFAPVGLFFGSGP